MSYTVVIAKYKKRDAAPFISRPYRDTMVYDEGIEARATILARVKDSKLVRQLLEEHCGKPDSADYRVIVANEMDDILQLLNNAQTGDYRETVDFFTTIATDIDFSTHRLVYRIEGDRD